MFKETIWNQFGASIDMLINVISKSPDKCFEERSRFYFIAYHSTIFLDYYLTFPPSDFSPLLPFTKAASNKKPKEAVDDLIPRKQYSKTEILDYLNRTREKCKRVIDELTVEKLNARFTEGTDPNDMDYPIVEILLYNLRHTQHHVAQLNLLARQNFDVHMEWSFRAGDLSSSD